FLLTALAINPKTNKPYATVVVPNQTLVTPVSTKGSVGLFAGWSGHKSFDPRGLILSDQGDAGSTIFARATFAPGIHAHPVVTQLSFQGDGGAVDSALLIQNIS